MVSFVCTRDNGWESTTVDDLKQLLSIDKYSLFTNSVIGIAFCNSALISFTILVKRGTVSSPVVLLKSTLFGGSCCEKYIESLSCTL